MRRVLVSLALLTVALVAVPTSAAAASDDDLHPDVEYALDAVPGGIAISDYEAVWPALGMTLEAGSPTARSVGSCATGTYCAYASTGQNGTKLTFTICTVQSTSALRTVGSIANARASGNVQARNSSGTTLGTASPNTAVNVAGGTTTLRCTL